MASDPITSWQIDGETVETLTGFFFCLFVCLFFLGGWCSKINAGGDCSHEIKTFALWNKSYDKPRQHIKKQRHHFSSKNLSSQSYDFSSNPI